MRKVLFAALLAAGLGIAGGLVYAVTMPGGDGPALGVGPDVSMTDESSSCGHCCPTADAPPTP